MAQAIARWRRCHVSLSLIPNLEKRAPHKISSMLFHSVKPSRQYCARRLVEPYFTRSHASARVNGPDWLPLPGEKNRLSDRFLPGCDSPGFCFCGFPFRKHFLHRRILHFGARTQFAD